MKRSFLNYLSDLLIPIIFTLVCLSESSAKDVGGYIFEDEIWSLSDSPYNLIADVIVKEGVTLTIEAGVELKLRQELTNTINNSMIKVEGNLIANGTRNNPINISGGLIYFTNLSEKAIYDSSGDYLEGCLLKQVNYDGARPAGVSGGNYAAIIVDNASVCFDNCIIQDTSGSAIRIEGGSAKISNCIIKNNYANVNLNRGGGIYAKNVDNLIIENCLITGNTAGRLYEAVSSSSLIPKGGGIYIEGGDSVAIQNNTISNNSVYNEFYSCRGGGIDASGIKDGLIYGNTIKGNISDSRESKRGTVGGMYVTARNCFIQKNIIVDNTATGDVGGISCSEGCILENNIIVGNTAYDGGGVSASCIMRYNTIARNKAERLYAGVMYKSDKALDVKYNSITDNIGRKVGAGYAVYIEGIPCFTQNNLMNNSLNKELSYIQGEGQLDATNCWWGNDEKEVWQKIDNWEGVDYFPSLSEAEINAPVIPPINFQATKLTDGDIEFTWNQNPESDLDGYRLYYGTVSGGPYDGTIATEGSSPIDVGITTSFTLTNLSSEKYYITLTAYDSEGNESWYSQEILNPFYTAPPEPEFPEDIGVVEFIIAIILYFYYLLTGGFIYI